MTIEKSPPSPIDPYAQSVIDRIDPKIRQSLSSVQLSAIAAAIGQVRNGKNHRIDWRGSIPLFFARYYYVVLLGRDLRLETRYVEIDRRQRSLLFIEYLVKAAIALFLAVVLLFLLYLLKSAMGINIFPNKHLQDFLL